jgi:Spy/CpxP family protein refolding chaperone
MTVLALVALGCDDKKASSSSGAPATTAQTPVTPPVGNVIDAGRPAREPRPQGPAAAVFGAARALELKDDVKEKVAAAEKLAAGNQDDTAAQDATKEATKNLYTELSTETKAGKIDPAKITPLYAPIEAATKPRLDAEADGLNQLHAALDPEQRKSLVADLRKKDAAREEHLAAHTADGGSKVTNRSDPHHIERLSKEIDLDEEQKAKVGAFALKDDGKEAPAALKKKKSNELLLAAFEKDTFDAKKLDMFAAKSLTEPLDEETKFMTKLIPLLKQEQRDKLAAKIEKGWPLYDRANPFLRGRPGAMMPGRLGPGGAPMKGMMIPPGAALSPKAPSGEGVPTQP